MFELAAQKIMPEIFEKKRFRVWTGQVRLPTQQAMLCFLKL